MTFSIAGFCARSGQIGYAVTTSSVAVGARVGAAIAGRAVVLSQARTDPRLHAVGLRSVEQGASAAGAVAAMVAAALAPEYRQLGVFMADGSAAAHTGDACTDFGGHAAGEHCLALGNALTGAGVLAAMVRGFEDDPGATLCDRLIAALAGGASAGGEWTALQSAALRVFGEHDFAYVDLRSDKSSAPIAALAALWEDFAPKADSYQLRAVDPARSPPADEIEAPPGRGG